MSTIPTKRRIESCLTIGPPRGPLQNSKSIWYWDRHVSFVDYRVDAMFATLQLSFSREAQLIEQVIQLVSTKPNYGGLRWWFLCPSCNRRVSRLHLPTQGCLRFLCRHCYDLSYESAQSSRKKSQYFFKAVARKLESTTAEARLWFRLTRGGVVHEVKRPIIERVRDRRTGVALVVTKLARAKGLSV
jgi:hypothetical protein